MRSFKGFLAAIALLVVCLSSAPASARMGTVDVKLANKTPGSTARLGDIEVRLFAFEGEQRLAEQQLLSTDDGSISFTDLEVTPERQFILSALFQGAVYVTHGAKFEDGSDHLAIEVPVYESTGDDSALVIDQMHVIITLNKEQGGYNVSEILVFKNQGERTLLGGDGTSVSVRLDVPEGIRDFQVRQGFLERHVAQGEGVVAITGPIYPGDVQAMFSYTVPTADTWLFRRRFDVPVNNLSVFTPVDGPAILGRELALAETLELEGGTFNRYSADPSASREGLRFEVSGSVTPAVSSASSAQEGPVGFIAAAILVIGVLFMLVRPLTVPAPAELVKGGRWVNKDEARRLELERSKERRLEAVREIDFDFETGKLSTEDYGPLREQYRAEAIAVLSELKAMDDLQPPAAAAVAPAAPTGPAAPDSAAPTEAAQPPAVQASPVKVVAPAHVVEAGAVALAFCTQCGQKSRPGDRFCGRCGASLPGAGA